MNKKYIVQLRVHKPQVLRDVIRKQSGSAIKVKRAHILLKVDQKGTGWTDEQVAEAFDCTVQTVQNVRRRLVILGFEAALEKKAPPKPPRQKTLNGRQESQLIAIRLGKPPRGHSQWSLRLLANRVVELGMVEKISPETIRQNLKKPHPTEEDPELGGTAEGERRIRGCHGECTVNLRRTVQPGMSGGGDG